MNRAISPWSTLLLAGLLLSGCSGLQQINMPVTGDARAFVDGFDQYMAGGDPASLKALPPGEWQARAEQMLALDKQQRQQQAQLRKLQKQVQAKDREIAALQQQIVKLESTLKQLKEVLIHSELQPK